jgi:CheY-like chemotaxis protein
MPSSRKFRVFRILLVEDDEQFAKFILTALNQYNFFVRYAGDGRYALKFLKEEPFDLMICDIGMPHMDGFKLLERSQSQKLRLPPVLMLTGLSDRDTVLKARAFGAVAYITKPTPLDQLFAKIREVLKAGEADFINKATMPFRADCAKMDGVLQIFITGCPSKDPVPDIKKEITETPPRATRIREANIHIAAEFACEGRAIPFVEELSKYLNKQLLVPWSSIRFKGSFFDAISLIDKEKFGKDHVLLDS